jgi:hypothetical protein
MFWLLSIAIFREYQYLKTYAALLYSFLIGNGKICNANMLLIHQHVRFIAINLFICINYMEGIQY